MPEIMKMIDEKETQKQQQQQQQKTNRQTNTKKQRQKRTRGEGSFSERVRGKWFCCAFMLGFLQLICKASLTFKSNLELALLIILKERELLRVKACCGGVYMLKNMRLLSFQTRSSILVLKWRQVSPL